MGRGPGSLYPDGLASSRSLLGAYSETSYGCGGGALPQPLGAGVWPWENEGCHLH